MIIFDAHLDLAWNAIDWNRDLRQSCEQIRKFETEVGMTDKGRCCNTVSRASLTEDKFAPPTAAVSDGTSTSVLARIARASPAAGFGFTRPGANALRRGPARSNPTSRRLMWRLLFL